MQIEDIQKLCERSRLKWSTHCLERMQERNIGTSDVKNCIRTGEIIEIYPNDFPHPSCLIYGKTIKDVTLHVVVGTDNERIFIITAYYPSTIKFENDLKTRKGN